MRAPPELGQQLAVGRTAELFAWGQDRVLKLYQGWVPAGDADQEAAMTHAVAALGLPVARCFGRIELNGRAGVLFERIGGTSLLDTLLHAPNRAQEIARILAGLQARLHVVRAPALPALSRRLAERIGHAPGLSSRWRAAALRLLQDLPDGEALCHGDFHPGNVIVTEQGPVIIDWIDVSRGHPLADVARTLMLVRYAEAPDDPRATAIIAGLRAAFVEAYLAAYRDRLPAAEVDLARWLPVVMAARLAEGADNDPGRLLNDLAAAFGPPGA